MHQHHHQQHQQQQPHQPDTVSATCRQSIELKQRCRVANRAASNDFYVVSRGGVDSFEERVRAVFS